MTKKFYITTAIDYPNAEPHIGHAYQKIVADVLARWHKSIGEDVWFLTGTDEHGKKIQESAEKTGKTPKQFVDELAKKFKEAWNQLNIKPNRFIRTTDEDHEKFVQEVIKKCNENGDIYKGEYEGFYCVGCEAYYTEKDLVDGKCPLHNRTIEKMKEESYFFKLSKYQKFLLDLYKKNPEFILPKERRNEIISRVKEGLKDLSISRNSFDWGIPFPLDKKHITYVWFDALFNYISGSGKNLKYWPANLHLLGKDNSWFHCVYWPAFLKSAGYELPKTVFVHGFLKFNGQKISKSLGNAISPKTLVEKYGTDTIRYFVCRQFPFATGDDGDFTEKSLIDRHNNELADKLGNLVSRVSTLIEKYGMKKNPKWKIPFLIPLVKKECENLMKNFELDKALNEIFSAIDVLNLYAQNEKPWEIHEEENKKAILYNLASGIKAITILLWPFIPETSEKIAKQFGFKVGENTLKEIETPLSNKIKIKKSEILFKKIVLEDGLKKGTKNSGLIKGLQKGLN
jgi:methionyl-tRNA synthetase